MGKKLHCLVTLKPINIVLDADDYPSVLGDEAKPVIKAVIDRLQKSINRKTACIHLGPDSITLQFVGESEEEEN